MKVCLSSRNTIEYLKKAQEIKVRYADREVIPDLVEDYPKATIILSLSSEFALDETAWNDIKMYNELAQNKFICCAENLLQMNCCKENNIKFYYGYPINSFYELRSLKNLGVSYVRLAPPLTHLLPEVAKFGIPVRAIPNVCYQGYLPHENGIHGQWIRPEEINMYDLFIDVIEFEDCNTTKEQALYRIYMEEQEWPGELNALYTNFNYPGVNRMIDPNLVRTRVKCGQRCEQNGSCHLCDTIIRLANPDLWAEYEKDMASKKQGND